MRALVLNDTRPGGHPGCDSVMQQLSNMLKNAGFENVDCLPLDGKFLEQVKLLVGTCDVVIINGEGTMHHDRPGALLIEKAGVIAKAQDKPIFLINTVWEANRVVNHLLECTMLNFARESISSANILNHGFAVETVPDLTLAQTLGHCNSTIPGEGSIIVIDSVCPKITTRLAAYAHRNHFDFYTMKGVPPRSAGIKAWLHWSWISMAVAPSRRFHADGIAAAMTSNIVITGRFHGACFAILAGRPFIAVSSNTSKIDGMIEDANLGEGAILLSQAMFLSDPAGMLEFHIEKLRELMMDPNRLAAFQDACARYCESAKTKAEMMFSTIAALGGKRGK